MPLWDGILTTNYEAKVMEYSGKLEASVGQKGELWLRGPTVMKGYWQNDQLTKEKLTMDRLAEDGRCCTV